MGNLESNIANIQQEFLNNITQNNQQSCTFTVAPTTNNNIVVVNGAKINGSFTGVSNSVSTDSSCLIVSNMDSTVSNILSATIQQSNQSSTDWFNGFNLVKAQTNTFDIQQSVVNNISQINQSLCSANITPSTNNNYVYVTDASVGGNFIGISSSTNASANCSLSNTMKSTTYNQAQASGTQKNTFKGMFAALLGFFAVIVGIIVIIVIILFAVGALGSAGLFAGKSTKSTSTGPNPQINEAQLEKELETIANE